MADVIEGIKLIYHTSAINLPDDPSYLYKLYVNLSPPEFMSFTFVSLYGGSEEIIVRGMTREALVLFMTDNDLYNHPRLRRWEITEG